MYLHLMPTIAARVHTSPPLAGPVQHVAPMLAEM
jgi:hypothetical protein